MYFRSLFTALILCLASNLMAAPQHRFVCVDNGWNTLIHIDQQHPGNNWKVAIPKGSRDLQHLDAHSLLVSHGTGAAEYDLHTGERLRWVTDRYENIQTARRLESGHTLLASIDGMLYEVDQEGKEIYVSKIRAWGLDIRLMRFTPQGTLLIGAKAPKAVLEVTRSGEIMNTLPLPGKGYKAQQLPDGTIIAGSGSMVKIFTFSPDGTTRSFVGGKEEHPEQQLDFCSGWYRLSNGNIVMANWQGHGDFPTAPHLVEFTPDNKAVWTWNDHDTAKQITNVLFLDE